MVLHIKAILDRLDLDFGGSWGRCCAFWAPSWLQLGAQERSRAAQERPRDLQERPRAAQERPRAAQERPRAAQDRPRQPKSLPRQPKSLPRADQDAQEQPRTCPGAAEDLPDPLQTPRLTHDFSILAENCRDSAKNLARIHALPTTSKKRPTSPRNPSELLFQSTKRPKSKTSGGGTPPQGGLQ